MRYRKDIDGLRALAVVPVVFFHAGIKPFSGGFIGVDVFFVISGYLITSLIEEEIRQGRFSIIRFYERRVRRIFPALFAVLIFASVAAWRLLMPHAIRRFCQKRLCDRPIHIEYPVLEGRRLLRSARDREAAPTYVVACGRGAVLHHLPAVPLHRSSLAERKMGRLARGASNISFALSVWGVAHKPSATFYLAPTRAWELLLGSLLAVRAIPQLESSDMAGTRWNDLVFGLIAWGLFTLTDQSPFPGANALFPAGGAALVIYSASNGETIISKLLATTAIGLRRADLLFTLSMALADSGICQLYASRLAYIGRKQLQ